VSTRRGRGIEGGATGAPLRTPAPLGPAGRVASATRRTFRSLRVRNYRLWFVGQTISLSGTWMQTTGQAWLVYRLTQSAWDLGLTAALQFLPILVFGAYGGVIADRLDKRHVLMATQLLFIVQALALWLVVATGAVQLWMVWTLAATLGFINVFDNPARQSFAIEMVGADDLANAVGLNSVIVNASRIVGPAIAGVLLVFAHQVSGMSWIFLVNAATFAAVLAALLLMRPDELHRPKRVRAGRGQVRAGLRYAWGKWELRVPLLMMAVIGTLAFNYNVLLPLFSGEVFHRGTGGAGAGGYGLLLAVMGAGALAGSLGVASRRRPRYRLLMVVTFAFGVLAMGIALAPTFNVALVLVALMGVASVAFIALANTLIQLHSDGQMRGRVMALWAIVFLGSTPIGAPIAGVVAEHFGARVALGMGAVATLLAAAYGTAALRRIRAEERREELAGGAPGAAAAALALREDDLPGEPEAGYEPGPPPRDAAGPAGAAVTCGSAARRA
jgi:MFS family permease